MSLVTSEPSTTTPLTEIVRRFNEEIERIGREIEDIPRPEPRIRIPRIIREIEERERREEEERQQLANARKEWVERVSLLQQMQAPGNRRQRRAAERSGKGVNFDIEKHLRFYDSSVAQEPTDVGEITLGGGKYKQVITYFDDNQGSGRSIFFASEDSCTPYLIIICNGHFITEYRLVSVTSANLPVELYLKLSEAILRAHRLGIVLGEDLNINNLKWDVSKDAAGLPIVIFKDLPPSLGAGGSPRPHPGISDSSGATKENDIYFTPTILSQMIFKIEDCIKKAMENRNEVKEMDTSSIPARDIVVKHPDQLPSAVKNNRGLLAIVKACLDANPAARPTASQLVKKLKNLATSAFLRDLVHLTGRCMKSALRRMVFLTSEY